MLTNGIQVQKYVKASAGRAGISVVFEECDHPRHDGRTIYLPRITVKTTEDELKQLMDSTDHEVAHDRFSDFEILKQKDMERTKLLMFIWNFLEDSRVNVIEAREYLGFRENYDECTAKLIASILVEAHKSKEFFPKLVTALSKWECNISSRYFPLCEIETSKYKADEKLLDVLNNFSDRLIDCQKTTNKKAGSKKTYDLAKEILKDLAEVCPEITSMKVASSDELGSDESGEGKKRVPKPKSEGEGDPKKSSSAGVSDEAEVSDGADTPPDDEEYKVIKIKVTEEDLKKFSLSIPEHGVEMSHIGLNFDPVAIHTGSWDLTDYEKFIVVNYPMNEGVKYFLPAIPPSRFTEEYKKEVGDKLVQQENFAQQVRRLIQIRAKVQTEYGVKKGKLDQSRLSRICFDAPGFSSRIFKRKIENKTLDAAITVLVDMSGSMMGMKTYYSLASTILLNEVCSTLNIPLEILGFTDGSDRRGGGTAPVMYIYKGFNNLHVSTESLIEYFGKGSSFMAGNPDGECIIWAYDRLLHRKEKKKILLVMSDGSPAASKGSFGLEKFTKTAIEEIEKAKIVDIYGLGLLSDSVTHYYQHNSVVNTAEQIPSKLLELIERKILS